MPSAPIPQISPDELARRLDSGEPVQLLDIRAAERVAQGAVSFGPTLDFRALPASPVYRLPHLHPLKLDPRRPGVRFCGHGNSRKPATPLLRERAFQAYPPSSRIAAL